MKSTLIKEELSAVFKNKKLLIPVIAVLFIPILYSGMFLWAFWNPYEHLEDLPVAVVNEDKGAAIGGEQLKLGNDLAKKLKDGKDFDFHFVQKEKGMKGLERQKYYMLIEIPSDFSKNATTLLDKNPKKLELIYIPNESYNFLSAQIGETAVEKIKAAVSDRVSETYAETMFGKIDELAGGLKKASDGSGKLEKGAAGLTDGSKELNKGLAALAQKSIAFGNGIEKADSGSKELKKGSEALANGLGKLQEGQNKLLSASSRLSESSRKLAEGAAKTNEGLGLVQNKIPEIISGTEKIETGSEQVASNLEKWEAGAKDASAGAAQVTAGINELQQQLNVMMGQLPMVSAEQKEGLNQALNQLAAGSKEVSEGTGRLAGAAGELSAGSQTLSAKIELLNHGQKELQQGIGQLASGTGQLTHGANEFFAGQKEFHMGMAAFSEKLGEAKVGADRLASGSTGLSGGLDQLADGAGVLVDGTDQLAKGSRMVADGSERLLNGSQELARKLQEGTEEASIAAGDNTYNMMADPVQLKNEKINEVPNYGTGFAPYFLSLGLFVGALLLSIVFPLKEPVAAPSNGFNWFASKFVVLLGIGTIQALLADLILLVGLGLKVKSVPLFILFTILTSLAFITLIQFLVTLFGDPGRFVAILILILQLTTSAGTFPLELIPNVLQGFNAFLPMTYSVQGLKAVISSGDFHAVWQNAATLLLFISAFMAGTIAYFQLLFKRQFTTAEGLKG